MSEIKCQLSAILGAKRINQAKCAELTGLSPTTVNALYNEKWNRIDKNTMLKLCQALDIQPGDLLIYEPKAEG